MPASEANTSGAVPGDASGESQPARNSPSVPLARLGQLVADGEVGWPTDLAEADAAELLAIVRKLRRAQLIRLIARAIAADIAASPHSGATAHAQE